MARKSARDRREELIEATVRVLIRDGVNAATTRAIAAEAGAPLASLHYCFDSRDELLDEAARRITDRAVTATSDSFARHDDLRHSVSALLQAFWKIVEHAPETELVSYEIRQYALRQEGLHNVAEHQLEHYLEAHRSMLRAVAATTGIEWTVPIDVLARYTHACLDGLSLAWLVDRDSTGSQQVLDLLTEQLLLFTRRPD